MKKSLILTFVFAAISFAGAFAQNIDKNSACWQGLTKEYNALIADRLDEKKQLIKTDADAFEAKLSKLKADWIKAQQGGVTQQECEAQRVGIKNLKAELDKMHAAAPAVAATPNPSDAWTKDQRAEITKCISDLVGAFKTANSLYSANSTIKLTAGDRKRYQATYRALYDDKYATSSWAKTYPDAMKQCNAQKPAIRKLHEDLRNLIDDTRLDQGQTADSMLRTCRLGYLTAYAELVKSYNDNFQHLSTRPKTQKKFSELKASWPPAYTEEDISNKDCTAKTQLITESDRAILLFSRNTGDLDK